MPDWTDARLDALRALTDPPADAFVAEEEAAGRLPALFAFLGGRGGASPAVRDWMDLHGALPADLDLARLRRGQAVAGRYGPQVMLGLLCKGLPECYASPKGAAHLLVAGRFARDPRERLMETAHFLDAVTDPGAFDGPAPRAVRETLKVRLVHAVARRYIRAHADYTPDGGPPINQEDMAGTLLAFSSLVLDALPRLGVDLTAEEEADYYYIWQVVGPVLGVREVPVTPDDGRDLFCAIRRRNHAPSPAGQVLTAALLATLADLIPGERLDGVPAALVWELSGPAVAQHLGVERPAGSLAVARALSLLGRALDAAVDSSASFNVVAEHVGRAVGDAVRRYGSEGRRLTYQPPGAPGR